MTTPDKLVADAIATEQFLKERIAFLTGVRRRIGCVLDLRNNLTESDRVRLVALIKMARGEDLK